MMTKTTLRRVALALAAAGVKVSMWRHPYFLFPLDGGRIP